ncbi:MAG: head-tail connector protein [Paracoccus sp. (in: a-proteobacteria)]|nr:head-tail connector protein [Paracoccus sp. (in: a-proteobacteria)]
MILVEETTPAETALPVAGLRAHLRLGSGFELAAGADEDRALAGFLRAAIATIEGRTGKVLLRRDFRMVLEDWRDEDAQALPLAPVSAVAAVAIEGADGTLRPVAPERWHLVEDRMRPLIRPRAGRFPPVPLAGRVVIRFTAGFAEDWAGVPADLAQAVMMLAARYYEDRGGQDSAHGLPMGVSALIERWRAVRVLAGRRAR